MGHTLFYLMLGAIPAYVLLESAGFRTGGFDDSGGPALFPAGVAWAMLGLIILQILRALVSGRQEKIQFLSLFKGTPGIFLASICLYALSLPLLGFILSSSLFLILGGGYLSYKAKGRGTWKGTVRRSVGFTLFSVALFLFFRGAVRIYLPTGVLGF